VLRIFQGGLPAYPVTDQKLAPVLPQLLQVKSRVRDHGAGHDAPRGPSHEEGSYGEEELVYQARFQEPGVEGGASLAQHPAYTALC